eukprot:6502429-Ditylum_brightwellii.AAC.1
MQMLEQSQWETVFIYPWCSCMNCVARRDLLRNHFGLPCSIPVNDASEVVLAGFNDGLLFDVIPEVDPVRECKGLSHGRYNHRFRRLIE